MLSMPKTIPYLKYNVRTGNIAAERLTSCVRVRPLSYDQYVIEDQR